MFLYSFQNFLSRGFRAGAKRGFTLIEIIVVITIIAFLGTAALSSYMNSTKTFTFLGKYKNFISSIRSARSYAMTNRSIDGEVPPRFGVQITEDGISVFADNLSIAEGGRDFSFDPLEIPNSPPLSGLTFDGDDFSNISISAKNSVNGVLAMPITLYYETETGFITIYQRNDSLVSPDFDPYISLRFCEKIDGECTEASRDKFVLLYQVSGLPEEYNSLE